MRKPSRAQLLLGESGTFSHSLRIYFFYYFFVERFLPRTTVLLLEAVAHKTERNIVLASTKFARRTSLRIPLVNTDAYNFSTEDAHSPLLSIARSYFSTHHNRITPTSTLRSSSSILSTRLSATIPASSGSSTPCTSIASSVDSPPPDAPDAVFASADTVPMESLEVLTVPPGSDATPCALSVTVKQILLSCFELLHRSIPTCF